MAREGLPAGRPVILWWVWVVLVVLNLSDLIIQGHD